jgi:hypothetical protein
MCHPERHLRRTAFVAVQVSEESLTQCVRLSVAQACPEMVQGNALSE